MVDMIRHDVAGTLVHGAQLLSELNRKQIVQCSAPFEPRLVFFLRLIMEHLHERIRSIVLPATELPCHCTRGVLVACKGMVVEAPKEIYVT